MSEEYEKIQDLLKGEHEKQSSSHTSRISGKTEFLYLSPISLVIIAVLSYLMKLSSSQYELLQLVFVSTGAVLTASASWLTWSFYINQTTRLGEANRSAWTNKSSKSTKSRIFTVYSGLTIDGLAVVNCIVCIIVFIILISLSTF